ncbi:metalloregulator ArsR/SmtB family transcription factor [Patescibacteria group bacterium]|nr:metalloregulator ArsR/SmtB family transcription factor [Patescibacteria group bacterium]MCG2701783.1 metalloregulator ArsR/SmtB family transcription factor [Candidatus Parcubacteria bacterium]MBU4264687.1 metalloregulator ArsR/SmtB family transcription factor [Patescibacteria group bacterium]MBU4390642.1 metalloregulator ArsR/SmtB family transcription factor [Patescibacteria group bacterium]MBU4431038.1 metalloregulator ArsR/SmtB family transcription factor [Patescibacteria group bacterium]
MVSDKVFKALADKNRRRVIGLLMEKSMNVNSLLKYFEISQATLSSHLAILKKAGLVFFRINGRERIYSLKKEFLISFVNELIKFTGIHEKSSLLSDVQVRGVSE